MNNPKRRTPQLRKRRPQRPLEDATLTGIIEINRILSYNLDIDSISDALHDRINLSFDTSSFFIALYDYERDRLTFPLVSEDGLRVEHEPIPVCGLSQAVMEHGVEFFVHDLDAEQERLQQLGVTPDTREPGQWVRSWVGVPLRSRQGDISGLIALQSRLPHHFTDQDLSRLTAFVTPLALALDNIRLTNAERDRRVIAAGLTDIGQLAGAHLEYDEVLEHMLDQLQKICGYDTAVIFMPSAADDRRMVISASHDPDHFSKGAEVVFAEFSPPKQSFVSQQPVVVAQVENFALWWESGAPDEPPTQSWLIVPMVVQQHIAGIILLGKLMESGYTQRDASNTFAVARQGAIALETARLQAQSEANMQVLQQRARRLGSINRISSVITSSLDRDEVFATTAQLLTELFEVDHCGIVMGEPDAEEAEMVAEYPNMDLIGLRISMQDNATMTWLAQYGTAVTIEDADDDRLDAATREALQKVGARSSLIAPLIMRDRVIGTVGLDSIGKRRKFTPEECETLVTIAGQVAMAVSHAMLYEEALAANRLKSAFLATISHELRTPLNAIIGYSDMLLSEFYGTLNEQQQDRLMRVNGSGKHLLTLIDDVLDLSKIEAGQITLVPQIMRLSNMLPIALDPLRDEAEAKHLEITVTIDPDEPLIRADNRYLPLIMSKLLKNAVKFTPEGSVDVEILRVQSGRQRQLHHHPADHLMIPYGDWVALRVSDTGMGISPENLDIIFESFRQVDNSTVREYSGTGLGLAITRRLVEMHEGYIWVASALDVGSVFTVLLQALFAAAEVRRDRPDHASAAIIAR